MDNALFALTVRVFYRKLGRMRYISHLDMNRCVSRALARSRLPVWRTMGFHPHIYLTFALPLSLGCESVCECFDFRLTQALPMEEVRDRLNKALPEELEVYDARPAECKPEAIAWADYQITLEYGDQAQAALERLQGFLALPELLVDKKGKAGVKQVDIRPHFQLQGLSAREGVITLELRCAAGPAFNLNPSLLLDAFVQRTQQPPEAAGILRKAILKADGTAFV